MLNLNLVHYTMFEEATQQSFPVFSILLFSFRFLCYALLLFLSASCLSRSCLKSDIHAGISVLLIACGNRYSRNNPACTAHILWTIRWNADSRPFS